MSLTTEDQKVVYAAIVHGKNVFLTEYNADPSSPAKDLAHVVLNEQLNLDDDNKVCVFLSSRILLKYIAFK